MRLGLAAKRPGPRGALGAQQGPAISHLPAITTDQPPGKTGPSLAERRTQANFGGVTGPQKPKPFLEALVTDLEITPSLTGLCAGFESGRWRALELARHLFEWLPEFALTASEYDSFEPHAHGEYLARAARAVYESDRYELRGEFGELLLHAAMRQCFDTVPAVAKVFFKDSANDTVKGFDAVHVVCAPDGTLELWLGEAKFYGDLGDALTAVAADLRRHTGGEWLRGEFVAIANKIDPTSPHAEGLRDLIHRNRSLDEIFARIRLPVLVSYDSAAAVMATASDDAYRAQLDSELRKAHAALVRKSLPPLAIHLLLVPLATKAELIRHLDNRLRLYLQL